MQIKIEGDEATLRYLAFLVENYWASNPAIDDDQIAPRPDPEAQGELAEQFRRQGVTPSDWEIG